MAKHIDQNGDVFELPNFTMKEIHNAIPPHCFEPSISRGIAYVIRDYFYLTSLAYLAYTYTPILSSVYLRVICYAAYTVLAGIIMTGIWIIAHECGHGAFSKSKTLNNTIGFILHTSLLVPYYNWRISHAKHHKSTGDLQRDTVFVPHSREYWVKHNLGEETDPLTIAHLSEDAPIVHLWNTLLHQVFGWHAFMLVNMSGQKDKRGFPQHSLYWFGTDSSLFKEHELSSVLFSDMGLLFMCGVLYLGVKIWGWWTVLVFYGIPYFWLNHWIVAVTFLQHTDGALPHFSHSQWTFARGAAATIDRDFGFIDTHFFHHIVGTHVVHHLISTIPFYHAQEATEAIKAVMGKHYHADRETPLMTALWKNYRDCQFVEETEGMDGSGVFMFRNLHGRGVKPRDLRSVEDLSSWEGSLPPYKGDSTKVDVDNSKC